MFQHSGYLGAQPYTQMASQLGGAAPPQSNAVRGSPENKPDNPIVKLTGYANDFLKKTNDQIRYVRDDREKKSLLRKILAAEDVLKECVQPGSSFYTSPDRKQVLAHTYPFVLVPKAEKAYFHSP